MSAQNFYSVTEKLEALRSETIIFRHSLPRPCLERPSKLAVKAQFNKINQYLTKKKKKKKIKQYCFVLVDGVSKFIEFN